MSTQSTAQAHGHVHGEAFMLMQYECSPADPTRFGTSCGAAELIWNSRDGVTPFAVDCRSCDGEARHIRWGEDIYLPDYTPTVGERIFVDLNAERALQKRLAFVEQWWDDERMPMRDHSLLGPLGKQSAAAHLAAADVDSFAPHTPDLIEVTDAVLQWLAAS